MRTVPIVLAALSGLLLAACASYEGRGLAPGRATEADVVAVMGEPAQRWRDPEGNVQLAYPRGPEGPHTFMALIDAGGHLREIRNVLNEVQFARIQPGATQEEVLRLIGPPQPQWTAFFAARNELVWEWRYCDGGNLMAKFDVLFDATTKLVRTAYSRPDYRGPEGVVPPCGQTSGR